MITFKNVTKIYKEDNVGLKDANIDIDEGEFVFLVGPSGAGKSTFINLISKVINPDSGQIFIDGKDITCLSNREIPELRRKIGMVFQDFRLLPKKTAFENVAFALEAVHKSKRRINKRVPLALEMVGIGGGKVNKYPDELSAGEQQRVAIARAIINKPKILICDEPTGNLDPVTADGIMDLLLEINDTGTTVVMVTHAKSIVDKMNKRVIVIENGRIVRDGYGKYATCSIKDRPKEQIKPNEKSDGKLKSDKAREIDKKSVDKRKETLQPREKQNPKDTPEENSELNENKKSDNNSDNNVEVDKKSREKKNPDKEPQEQTKPDKKPDEKSHEGKESPSKEKEAKDEKTAKVKTSKDETESKKGSMQSTKIELKEGERDQDDQGEAV